MKRTSLTPDSVRIQRQLGELRQPTQLGRDRPTDIVSVDIQVLQFTQEPEFRGKDAEQAVGPQPDSAGVALTARAAWRRLEAVVAPGEAGRLSGQPAGVARPRDASPHLIEAV